MKYKVGNVFKDTKPLNDKHPPYILKIIAWEDETGVFEVIQSNSPKTYPIGWSSTFRTLPSDYILDESSKVQDILKHYE